MGVLGGLVSGLAFMAGALAVVRALYTPLGPPAKPLGLVRVVVRSAVPNGQLFVDSQLCGVDSCELSIRSGPHEAEARLPGYTGEKREFVAKAGLDFELSLQLLPSVVEVVSDLTSGELRLDDKAPIALAGGGAQVTNIEPGEHRLRFIGGPFHADFKFESRLGAVPRLLVPPSVSGLRAIVVAGAGAEGRLWSSETQAELAIGARELGSIPEDGLALPAMERGTHRFVLKKAKGPEVAFVHEIADNPTIWISLRTNRKLGTLRILANAADDAKVILDGKDSGVRIRRGRAFLLAAPGRYEVSVEKAGFLTPPEQRASIQEGNETEVEFKLTPIPTRATLSIAGAPSGAALSVDDRPVGVAGVDGTALVGDLDSGLHVVTARSEGYLPSRWELKLGAGRNAVLRASMQRAQATLRIVTTPAGGAARVTLRRLGQFDERVVSEPVLVLPEGEYTVTAVDAKGQRIATRVRLEAGKEATAALTIGVEAAPAPTAPSIIPETPAETPAKRISLTDWDGAPGWTRQGDRIVNEGGGIMLAPVRASAQSITFTAHVPPGRPVRWVTQFRDLSNYTLYELRGDGLSRIDVVRGKRVPRNRSPVRAAAAGPVRVRMSQLAGVLRTSVNLGGQWVDLDTADAPTGTGRFGFYLPEREPIALSEFNYEYR